MKEQWQELKETITELRDNDGTATQQEVCKFLANLMELLENQMSSSENPNKWIPVLERLPEKGKQVLCCNKSGSVFTSAITYINSNGMVAFGQHYEVIAWMPLPEPYKEGGEQNE